MALGLTGLLAVPGCGRGRVMRAAPIAAEGALDAMIRPTPDDALPVVTEAVRMNLALNLEYVGAQFYGFAANGVGLSGGLTSGVGRAGVVGGARRMAFDDPAVAAYAAEGAADKMANVAALREQLDDEAAAAPAIDFSATETSPFSRAAQAAGVVPVRTAYDPFASDANFLLAAFLIDDVVAAAYRTASLHVTSDGAIAVVSRNLGDAVYRGGLSRSMLSRAAADDPALARSMTAIGALMARLDGSDAGGQEPADNDDDSANITDAAGRPIPFTRSMRQVLAALYFNQSAATSGGFLPFGANGLMQ